MSKSRKRKSKNYESLKIKRRAAKKARIRNKKRKRNLIKMEKKFNENLVKFSNCPKENKIILYCIETFYLNSVNMNNLRFSAGKRYEAIEIDKNVYRIMAEKGKLLTVSCNFVDKYFRKV